MKILLTGAHGQLGSELQATCPAGITLIATDRDTLDITQPQQVIKALEQHHPDVVINGAAYTAVDKAETDTANAYLINHAAAQTFAAKAALFDYYLLQISTDFVFDGLQSTPYLPNAVANPLGVYGASKLAGEQAVQAACPSAAIVRTSWLYSAYGNNFVKTMLRLMRERDALGVVADQVGTPTWTGTLATTLWSFIAQKPQGILHCADNGVASWYDFAVAIQEEALALGLLDKAIPIKPLRTDEYPTPARRPAFSVMDRRATETLLGYTLPHWRTSLRQMLTQLKQQHVTA
ncbi:dTDP-4-dehydrorhamnose reductase [Thiothrix subterranea]|uniref:dTDP-4-dehydrorhamnose reductase n=1 Tax=Thiothrix subterranea TaxID=2735563 RepID=A0AA51MPN7_9GAMM|nr:dTDP-4-dehydrorhamnose reductase [Thiothrix subterranea]MDQ5770685.1 dTDP-4-dehydrorhamnose reductase [Thiothrix subterranea]WML85951.1 dTDP-4-dehydrorhamnose reductase [Thiothrix subterranea]